MSKMKELAMVLDELVSCGEHLIETANTIRDIFNGDTDEAAPTDTATAATETEASEAPPLTKEDVRGILASKSAKGFGDDIRALLSNFGAKQLKQVNPADYAALVAKAQKIGEVDSDA